MQKMLICLIACVLLAGCSLNPNPQSWVYIKPLPEHFSPQKFSDIKPYIDSQPIFTAEDILAIDPVADDPNSIRVTLTAEATKRLIRMTGSIIHDQLALVIHDNIYALTTYTPHFKSSELRYTGLPSSLAHRLVQSF